MTIKVSNKQFGKLLEITNRLEAGVISDSQHAAECQKVCPELKIFERNQLEVQGPIEVPHPRMAFRLIGDSF